MTCSYFHIVTFNPEKWYMSVNLDLPQRSFIPHPYLCKAPRALAIRWPAIKIGLSFIRFILKSTCSGAPTKLLYFGMCIAQIRIHIGFRGNFCSWGEFRSCTKSMVKTELMEVYGWRVSKYFHARVKNFSVDTSLEMQESRGGGFDLMLGFLRPDYLEANLRTSWTDVFWFVHM